MSPAAVNQHYSGQETPSRLDKRLCIIRSGCAEDPQQAAATQALADTPMELWSYTEPAQDTTSAVPSSGAQHPCTQLEWSREGLWHQRELASMLLKRLPFKSPVV